MGSEETSDITRGNHQNSNKLKRLLSPSNLITAVCIFDYLRSALYGVKDFNHISNPSINALVHFGGNLPSAVFYGEYWRVATSIFLHADPMHILFNLTALRQIGPVVEALFGKGRMLFFFMATGIIASVGSCLLRNGGVGIGASGALMGLVGLTAGWGHKNRESVGTTARDLMLKWGVYTIVFGFIIHADNIAHVFGFISGLIIGLTAEAKAQESKPQFSTKLETFIGGMLFALTVVLVNFPPPSVFSLPLRSIPQSVVHPRAL